MPRLATPRLATPRATHREPEGREKGLQWTVQINLCCNVIVRVNHLLGAAQHLDQVSAHAPVLGRNERVGGARDAGASRPADPVDVPLGRLWTVVVDHRAHVLRQAQQDRRIYRRGFIDFTREETFALGSPSPFGVTVSFN